MEHVNNAHTIISDANDIQHLFSNNDQLSLWHTIPMIEELQTAWEEKCRVPQYQMYSAALDGVLRKIRKYYTKFNEKSVYVLSLSK